VVEAVVPDEVAIRCDASRELRDRLDPAALEEPGRPNAGLRERVEQPVRDATAVRPVGVLRIERERDAERSAGRSGHEASVSFESAPDVDAHLLDAATHDATAEERLAVENRKDVIGDGDTVRSDAGSEPGRRAIT
jgi:hypothetical protein